jgi:uncharacterized FlaG/YvyC family protein
MQSDQTERRERQQQIEERIKEQNLEASRKLHEEELKKKAKVKNFMKGLDEYFDDLRDKNDERYSKEFGSVNRGKIKIDPKEGYRRLI